MTTQTCSGQTPGPYEDAECCEDPEAGLREGNKKNFERNERTGEVF